jgi:hypothetical protein
MVLGPHPRLRPRIVPTASTSATRLIIKMTSSAVPGDLLGEVILHHAPQVEITAWV